MTSLEIILLCILMVVSTASGVVIWKLRQDYNGFKRGAEIVISQMAEQLHYLQTQQAMWEDEDEDSWETLH